MQLKSQIGHIECLNSATLSEFVVEHYKSPCKDKHILFILPPKLKGVALYKQLNSTGIFRASQVTSEPLPYHANLWHKFNCIHIVGFSNCRTH